MKQRAPWFSEVVIPKDRNLKPYYEETDPHPGYDCGGTCAIHAPKLKTQVVIVKCQCGSETCDYYGLSDGAFDQGTGWKRERAQQYADAINAYDAT